jgi:hypothetical protein
MAAQGIQVNHKRPGDPNDRDQKNHVPISADPSHDLFHYSPLTRERAQDSKSSGCSRPVPSMRIADRASAFWSYRGRCPLHGWRRRPLPCDQSAVAATSLLLKGVTRVLYHFQGSRSTGLHEGGTNLGAYKALFPFHLRANVDEAAVRRGGAAPSWRAIWLRQQCRKGSGQHYRLHSTQPYQPSPKWQSGRPTKANAATSDELGAQPRCVEN